MRQLLVGTALACLMLAPAPAMADATCRQLTIERHAIMKDAGFCFKSAWAIDYFGNAGCRYDGDVVPLTPRARRALDAILAQEEAHGCW